MTDINAILFLCGFIAAYAVYSTIKLNRIQRELKRRSYWSYHSPLGEYLAAMTAATIAAILITQKNTKAKDETPDQIP